METILFDEAIRDLIVFLKGQIMLLAETTDKDDAAMYIKDITSKLRTALNKLDSAAYQRETTRNEVELLKKEISKLKQDKTSAEDSFKAIIDSEQTKSEEAKLSIQQANEKLENEKNLNTRLTAEIANLQNRLATVEATFRDNQAKSRASRAALNTNEEQDTQIHQANESGEDEALDLNDVAEAVSESSESESASEKIQDEKAENIASSGSLNEEISKLNEELQQAKSSQEELKNENDQLKEDIAKKINEAEALQKAVDTAAEEIKDLKQRLVEADDIESSPQFKVLKEQLELGKSAQSENKDLKLKIVSLEHDLSLKEDDDNIRELYEQARESESKLHEELANTQGLLQVLKEKADEANTIQQENSDLKSQLHELKDSVRNLLEAQKTAENSDKSKFAFSSDACLTIFDTLSSASHRLNSSVENKDLYQKVREAMTVFESSNAIKPVPTVGQRFDPQIHRVTKTYRSDILPDGMIVFEESAGYTCAGILFQKASVWIVKSTFVCTDCGNVCRPNEFFCPKCGLELTSPDGAGKRNLQTMPLSPDLSVPVVDMLMKQGEGKAALEFLKLISDAYPDNTDVRSRLDLLNQGSELLKSQNTAPDEAPESQPAENKETPIL